MKNTICCLCGAPRRPTQAPLESFCNDARIINMRDHRSVRSDAGIEANPQLIVSVSIYRNGGICTIGRTHMCDDCVIVGLKHAKAFVDESLTALGDSQPERPS